MDSTSKKVPFIEHHFQTSSLESCTQILAPTLFPDWAPTNSNLEITKLTEGTTNSLFKTSHRSRDVDTNVLIKVYGSGTDITIDREKELYFHSVLAEHKLAPAPLVRFRNGHAYPFVDGRICSLEELPQKEIGYCVAQEIANWHGYLPKLNPRSPKIQFESVLPNDLLIQPNVWITAQKWLKSIPEASEAERATKENLTEEFTYLLQRLHGGSGQEMVFTHGDLLHANIVITNSCKSNGLSVRFIDYEHSTYAPPAFELANHFSEWAGFSCNYESLPSRERRRSFIEAYLERRNEIFQGDGKDLVDLQMAVDKLMFEVDSWRGFPGFYWGLCALIQHASNSGEVDFDYHGYAQLRLAEYYAWKGEEDGSRVKSGIVMPLREKFWDAESSLG